MSLQLTIEYLGTKKLFGGMKKGIDPMIHDALTDRVDLGAEYWDFHQKKLTEVKRIIRREYEHSTEGIRVTVNWVSDPVEKDLNETIESLLDRFNKGQVGTRERYTIRKEPQTEILQSGNVTAPQAKAG